MHDATRTSQPESKAVRRAQAQTPQTLGGMLRFSAVTLFCGAILLGTARRSSAATITVTNTNDTGPGSLRAAITQANADPAGDTINFNLPFPSTILLTSGDLPITNTMSITGAVNNGMSIYSGTSRVFNISGPSNVSISNLRIEGRAAGLKGGGIYAVNSNVTLNSVSLNGCTAQNGAGIYSNGALNLINSRVLNCTATVSGGGVLTGVGAGPTLISGSVIRNCTAANGGGVFADNSLVIQNSTISGCHATQVGGGVDADSSSLTMRNSTVAYNSATVKGGGLYLSSLAPAVTLQSTILSGNTAPAGADAFNHFNGVSYDGTLNADHSLFQVSPGAALNGANTANIVGQAAQLGSPLPNGGTTLSLLPNAGSPALGAGSNPAGLTTDQRGAPRPLTGSIDIGSLQVQPARSLVVTNTNDSGPGSLRAAAGTIVDSPSTITFDPVVFAAPQAIAVTTGDILIDGPFTISGPGVAKLTVDAKGASRIFVLNANPTTTVAISGMTIANGAADTFGGGINGAPQFYNYGFYGGAKLTLDTVTITGCHTTGAQLSAGGAIFSFNYLTLNNVNVTGCSSSGPRGFAGGVFSYYLYATNSTFTGNAVISTNSSGNSTLYSGGGILSGLALIKNCTISGNSATASGGAKPRAAGAGLSVFGYADISNSTISGNVAQASNGTNGAHAQGGGIYSGGKLTIQNSTISGNSVSATDSTVAAYASAYGGGIYASGNVQIYNCTVVNNSVSAIGASGSYASGGGSYVYNTFNSNPPPSQLLVSTIAAKNTSQSGIAAATPDDLGGNIDTTSSNNLIGVDTNVSGISNGAQGNKIGTAGSPLDPVLGPLQNNGGVTETHAVLPGSPAIGAGLNTTDIFNSPSLLTTDQRDVNYPRARAGNVVDIGAIQLDQTAPIARLGSAPDVTNASDPNHYTFTVIFSDNAAINPATFGNSNVLVTGPNGFSQLATFVSSVPSIPGSPVTATYQINAPGGSWVAGANGVYTIAVLANQVKDTTGNLLAAATLGTFNVAVLSIISPPVATPNPAVPGQPVVFTAGAVSTTGVTYFWNFGDGTTASGSTVTHLFGVPSIYTVTLTVTDANGQSVTSVFLLPVNAGVKTPFKLRKIRISLNFAQINQDQIQLSGILPLTPGFNPSGQTLSVDVGHVVRAYKLDASGRAINSLDPNLQPFSANDVFKLKPGKSARQFTLKIGFGSFQQALNSETDPNQDLPAMPGKLKTRKVRVTLYIDNAVYEVITTQRYVVRRAIGTFGH